ncbi:hypothetical protein HKCCE4037_16385 [Rhodobacterales bacterium HKCCE4037]|nr:hypothetical protein [Rhodobacterales bacterium HKCCE4037]
MSDEPKNRWSFALRPFMGSEDHIVPTLMNRWDEGSEQQIFVHFDPDRRVFWLVFFRDGWRWGSIFRRTPSRIDILFNGFEDGPFSLSLINTASFIGKYIGVGLGVPNPGSKTATTLALLSDCDSVSILDHDKEIFHCKCKIPSTDMISFIELVQT